MIYNIRAQLASRLTPPSTGHFLELSMEEGKFAAGRNIAMKVPPHQYEATVAFYRDIVRLPLLKGHEPAVGFVFGEMHLWIDRVSSLSQAEVWLEIVTNDLAWAEKMLASHNVVRCDAIEALPAGFQGFWIINPASIVHLVDLQQQSW